MGDVVSTMVELPVPGKSDNDRLIPSGDEVGDGVGSSVAVAEGCSDSGDEPVGSADGEAESVGSADADAGVLVTGAVEAVSVTFGDGRTALVTSETIVLSIEPIGANGSLGVGEGSSLVLVTIPVGARSMPLVLVDSSEVSPEENKPDEEGSADGLAVADGVSAEAVGGTELVGRIMVAGMPPVEATSLETSAGLSVGVGAVIGSAAELAGVGSVDGGTTTVLSTMIVVTLGADPELSDCAPVESGEPIESVESAELG